MREKKREAMYETSIPSYQKPLKNIKISKTTFKYHNIKKNILEYNNIKNYLIKHQELSPLVQEEKMSIAIWWCNINNKNTQEVGENKVI